MPILHQSTTMPVTSSGEPMTTTLTPPNATSLPPDATANTTAAAAGALRTALRVAMLAAVVPTVLSAQGMVSVGTDVLGLHLAVALALAGFLELGLIASAMLARASALAGRPAGADAWATWALSALSGVLSATHELVGPVNTMGERSWQHDPGDLLAAGVRLAAPLVAAWLWERCLVSARRQTSTRSLSEVLRDRRMLAVARAALAVRRAETTTSAGPRAARQLDRARRRLDRAHLAALRHLPATDPTLTGDLTTWLATVGAVDTLPALTRTTTPSAVEAAEPRGAHQDPDAQCPQPSATRAVGIDVEPVASAVESAGGELASDDQDDVHATVQRDDDEDDIPAEEGVGAAQDVAGEEVGQAVRPDVDVAVARAAAPVPARPVVDPVPLAGGALALAEPAPVLVSTGDRGRDAVAVLEVFGRDITYHQLAEQLAALGWVVPAGTSTRQRILTDARRGFDAARAGSRLAVVR